MTSDARWLSIALAGEPVGRGHEVREARPGGGFATHTTSELRIGRLGSVVEMAFDIRFEEDPDGVLQAARVTTQLSRQVTTVEARFAPRVATIRETAAGRAHDRTVELPGALLGPEAIRRGLAAHLRRPGDVFAYVTWSAELTAPQRVRCQAEATERVAIEGVPRSLLRVKISAEGAGPPRQSWLDAQGRELRSESTLPFGTMVATEVRAEPQLGRGELPADVFTRTIVRSNVRLPAPRALDKLVVDLALDDPEGKLAPIDGGDQRVTVHDATHASVEIERVRVPPAAAVATPAVGPEFLAANATIDPGDPQVQQIARDATAGAVDPWDQAQRLQRWVTTHMTFDAGIAFAPAGELARDRHGTCAGYAVLLASLLRAAGIPARLDLGLVYVDGAFGGHAWVEAYLRGRWVPLDAAVPSDGPADPARIAFARDALDRGAGAAMSAFGQVAGRLKIRVRGYAPGDQPLRQVGDVTRPYAIEGARYTNPGLGFSITLPAGARFVDADAVWPDPTVVAVERAQARVTIEDKTLAPGDDPALGAARAIGLDRVAACTPSAPAHRASCATARDGVRLRSIAHGRSVLVLKARHPDGATLLDAVASTLRLDDER